MQYRREIDGLRALAVIPVILFHAGFTTFSGGFVGVDVFFVISGYLITTIILAEKEKGTFSLVNFYERRARRILPALFTVMLVSLAISWFSLSPNHMKDFSASLVAVSTFSSNILFWLETGYWGVENELKPLLHTWSLAVEEQYYVLFPLFLMLMWKFRKRWILGSFLIVAFISLLLAQYGSDRHPVPTFFLLPTRGWELAIGASIAFYFLYRKKTMRTILSHSMVDDLLGLIGLLMIGYSVLAFNENTPFPGFSALIPTIGTGLIIIFSSSNTYVGQLLGTKLLVGIGLISYSAYLWHQPLFVFARHFSLTEPGKLLFALLSVASIILAYISWKVIEKPFREKGRFTREQIFGLSVVASAVFIVIGVVGYYTNGWPDRIDQKVRSSLEAVNLRSMETELCLSEHNDAGDPNGTCPLVEGNKDIAYLYGDSHAQALAHELKHAFNDLGHGLKMISKNACPPVIDVYRFDQNNDCFSHNDHVYRFIKNDASIEYVILIARWTLGMEGSRFDNKEGGIEHGSTPHLDLISNGNKQYHEDYSHRELIGERYKESITRLLAAGKKVILVYPIPEVGWNVPDYVRKYYWRDPDTVLSSATASTSYDVFKRRNKRTIEALDKIGSHQNLYRVKPEKIFCNTDVKNRCIAQKDGELLYRDDDHVSNAGAKLIVEKIMGIIGDSSKLVIHDQNLISIENSRIPG